MKPYRWIFFAALTAGCASTPDTVQPPAAATQSRDIFVVRSTDKSPDAVVEAIEAYAKSRKWPYLGADKVKQDQVILVKICIPEVGQQLWPVGLHLSAMLPCGNFGVYRKDGRTEISLLHPRYMQLLYPDPAVEKAAATAAPLLIGMLDEIAR